MQNPVPLYCPNPQCQAPNQEANRFCQQCHTPIVKRYLWLLGQDTESFSVGSLLGNRYLVKRPRIVLDTQPGCLPDAPEQIAPEIDPYLRLIAHQFYLPQVYGRVKREADAAVQPGIPGEWWLLERAPIYPEGVKSQLQVNLEGTLIPALTSGWAQASALRQLNWLWQISRLWHPLSQEKVARSLLTPELLRIDESILRLLELRLDGQSTPTLRDLGALWQNWQPTANPAIASFLQSVCDRLMAGQFQSGEQLTTVFDRALQIFGQNHSRQITLATLTDQGPTRHRNEDACYPPSGAVRTLTNPGWSGHSSSRVSESLVLVCDGIGGHEGGDVASQLAITMVQQQLESLTTTSSPLRSMAWLTALRQATLTANDAICHRNDAEHREERQRMGTTLLAALVHGHEFYLTHVGDSRAYLVTRTGCHQIGVDDDLASREVRFGSLLYRQALHNPASGSLVQALGMNPSFLLHPTTERLILDEPCVVLLCSDGLSDNDRVEQYWQTELLPILEGKRDLVTASHHLVTIANEQNGHDNVTVGLIHCQVTPLPVVPQLSDPALTIPPPFSTEEGEVDTSDQEATALVASPEPDPSPPQIIPPRPWSSLAIPLGLGAIAFTGLIGLLLYSMTRTRPVSPPLVPSAPVAMPTPVPIDNKVIPSLEVGTLVQISGSPDTVAPVTLFNQPGPPQPAAIAGRIPVGSVIQITSRQVLPNQQNWLKLKICALPPDSESMSPSPLQPGSFGWLEQAVLAPLVTHVVDPSLTGACAPSPATPSP